MISKYLLVLVALGWGSIVQGALFSESVANGTLDSTWVDVNESSSVAWAISGEESFSPGFSRKANAAYSYNMTSFADPAHLTLPDRFVYSAQIWQWDKRGEPYQRAGLMFNGQTYNKVEPDGYYAYLWGGDLNLFKITNGVTTNLETISGAAWEYNVWHNLTAQVVYTNDGTPTTQIKIFLDGNLIATVVDTNNPYHGGYAALVNNGASASYFDDITISGLNEVTLSPAGGTLSDTQSVVVTCATPGAVIRYTTDGNEPTLNYGITISSGGSVLIDRSLTLKARAWVDGVAGELKTAEYILNLVQGALFSESVTNGTLDSTWVDMNESSSFTWAISSEESFSPSYSRKAGAYYAYNMTSFADPAHLTLPDSFMYSAQIWQWDQRPYQRAGLMFNGQSCDKVEPNGYYAYLWDGNLNLFKMANGAATNLQTIYDVALPYNTWHNLTAQVAYTNSGVAATQITIFLDGNLLTTVSDTNNPYHGGYTALVNNAASNSYFDDIVIADRRHLSLSPAGGTFDSAQSVVITCMTPGAVIRYTTDGSEPTMNHGTSISSGGTVVIDHSLTLKARAWVDGVSGELRAEEYVLEKTVSGAVVLGDFLANATEVAVTINLCNPDGSVAESHVVHGGAYSFTTTRYGTYDLTAKAGHWLQQKISGVTLGNNPVNFGLVNGDCDGNNAVDPADLSILLIAMDSTQTTGDTWNPRADLDGDGEVTSTDLSIVLTNTNATGNEGVSTVYADAFGFSAEDATSTLQAVIDSGVSKIIVRNMGTPWILNQTVKVQNRQNLELDFEKGAVLLAKEECFRGGGDMLFLIVNSENITLNGYGATFQMRKQDYMNPDLYPHAEWRTTLSIYGGHSVTIQGLTLRDSGGDGIFIGDGYDGFDNASRNIVIKDVLCDNHYRQGMSVISVDGLTVENCVFSNTGGTAPQAGVDFESDYPFQILKNIVVRNSIFANNAGAGMMFYMGCLDGKGRDVTATIENCTFFSNALQGLRLTSSAPNLILRNNLFVSNFGYGVEQNLNDLSSRAVISYSAFWNNASGPMNANVTQGAGTLTTLEPIFASTDQSRINFLNLASGCTTAISQGSSSGSYMGARAVAP